VADLRAELEEMLDELEDEASSLGLYDEWYPDGEAWTNCLTRQRSSRPMRSGNSPIT
jgi:hypothetical protein